jgi:MFS transporter, AAHS family, 4-hydroxybenzoate transporter
MDATAGGTAGAAAVAGGTAPGSILDVSAFLDRPRVGTYRLLIFALCILVMTIDGYDVFVVGYLVPALAQDFGVSMPAVTSIFVFQTIGLGVGAYAVSPFADRFGRRNIILMCTVLMGALTLAGMLATSVASLAAFRFLASFCFGAVVPNLVAVTSEYCSRQSRATLVIILFMGWRRRLDCGGARGALRLACRLHDGRPGAAGGGGDPLCPAAGIDPIPGAAGRPQG